MRINKKFTGTFAALTLLSTIFALGVSQTAAQAATCSGTNPISVNTSDQGLVAGDTLIVTFKNIGKGCALGNFKMITASRPYVNNLGLLYTSASTADITLNAFPNPTGSNNQTVTFNKSITSGDEFKFYQFVFTTTVGVATKSNIVSVYPANYHEPQDGVVDLTVQSGYQVPYYFSNISGLSYFGNAGDLTYDYTFYNCGAPGSDTATAAISDPTIADGSCDVIDSTNGYSYFRGNLSASRPNNTTNSVLVSRVIVSDIFGSSSPFFSAAMTTPTYAVTAVSKDTTYLGGGETITVTGVGLNLATIIWSPNAGESTLLSPTNISDTQTVFTVPAPTSRSATSATITIYPVGGEIVWPNAISLTKSAVATLSSLTISAGTLTPSFSTNQETYTATLPSGTSSITITPTFNGYGETVTVASSLVLSGVASSPISTPRGVTTISVIGSAEDGSTKTYTLTLTRPLAPALVTPTVTVARSTDGVMKSFDLQWGAISNRSSYSVKIYDPAGTTLLKTIESITATSLTIDSSNYPEIGGTIAYKFTVTAIGDVENYASSGASNILPNGSVSISSLIGGSAFEGRTVSANTSGLPSGTYTYKWFSGEDSSTLTEITGVTTLSYAPTASDRSLSNQMYLAVRATLNTGAFSYTSPAVPVYTYPNAIGGSVTSDTSGTYTSGKYRVGQTVYGRVWSVMGTPWPTLNYQWWICNTFAATSSPSASGCTADASGSSTHGDGYTFSYTVPNGASGKYITFSATLTNAATTAQGTAFTATQSRIMNSGIINSAPSITGSPDISAAIESVGKRFSASAVTYSGTPAGKISYQWQRCTTTSTGCSNISGATSTSYTATNDDLDKYLRVVATATSNAGGTATKTSTSSILVNPAYATPSGMLVSLGGAPSSTLGQTLSANITAPTVGFPVSFTYTYQWQRCSNILVPVCGNISGATSSTYTTISSDLGRYVRVQAKATNAAGSSAWVTSSNRAGVITR